MSLVLTFCWREWRAQRAVLTAFTAMGLAALAIVFTLLPEHWWLEDGRCAAALSWFVVLGGVGVIAFAAPALVRGEYGAKGDQFVQRLPGALVPSFAGKLLFLGLVAAALPLVCLLVGQGFLLAIGRHWHDLYQWTFAGDVAFVLPWPLPWLGGAALLTTWVWALGTWLPSGRMALGAVILFVLAVGAVVVVVLRQSPGIEKGIAWQSWLWLVPVLGVVVAGVSWALGRRGGGAWRSAKFGAAAAAIGFAPPALWFADRAHDYHFPEPDELTSVQAVGLTPDLRYAFVRGAEHDQFASVPFRVDLSDGTAVRIGGPCTSYDPVTLLPGAATAWGTARYWHVSDWSPWTDRTARHRVLDLATLDVVARSAAVECEDARTDLTDALRSRLAIEPAALDLQAPNGVQVWFDGAELCFAVAPGRVERVRWAGDAPLSAWPAGHGLRAFGPRTSVLFDLTTRRVATDPSRGAGGAWLVRGVLVHDRPSRVGWWRRERGSEDSVAIEALHGARILGLLDDDRLLCQASTSRDGALFAWTVATSGIEPILLPLALGAEARVGVIAPLLRKTSLLPRDAAGYVWLTAHAGAGQVLFRLEPATLVVAPFPRPVAKNTMLLAWLDANTWLVQDGRCLERLDLATGVATRLFPRATDGGAR